MTKISRFILLAFTFSVTIFLYQNCGQEGKIFSECTTSDCSLASLKDLSIDTSFVTPAIPNGGTLTVGVNQTQETSSSNTYKNIQLQGQCSTGGFNRHQIRWSVSCDGECNLRPNRGSAQCDSSGTYFISEYVRGLRTDNNRPNYTFNLEIVALDEFDNPLYGGENSSKSFVLNPVAVIRPPTLFNFSTIPGSQITRPIIVVDTDPFDMRGLCDRTASSQGDQATENLIRIKFELPGTSQTIRGSTGFISTTNPTSDRVVCRAIAQAELNIQSTAQSNGNRSGFFEYPYPDLTLRSTGPGFECSNCLPNTFSRLLQIKYTQTSRVGSISIPVNSSQLYMFKSNNLNRGKGWTAETLYEIGLRIVRTLSFSSSTSNSLDNDTINALASIMSLNPTSYDARDDGTNPDGSEQTSLETVSLRLFILNRMGSHQERGRRFSPNPRNDNKIQAFASGNDYANLLKYLTTDISRCGFSENVFSDPVVGENADIEMERLTLCFTRFFFFGLHGDSLDEVRNIVTRGLNISGSCAYKDGEAAPVKYCEKAREFLRNSVSTTAPAVSLLSNPTTANYSLPGLKQKFLNNTSLANLNSSDKRFEFFINAVVQLYTNSIMREISRHIDNGISNSFFMQNVLNTVYGRFLPTNMPPAEKLALYSQIAPSEKNHANGLNNFSAYTSQSEVGSINTVGSITCVPTPADNPTQCNN